MNSTTQKAFAKKRKTKKPKAKRATAKKEPAKYDAWRYFKRANLIADDDATLLSKILELTGFKTLDALQKELSQYERFKLPKELQKRIAKLFDIKIGADEWDEHTVPLEFQDQSYGVPFPFKMVSGSKVTNDISAFWVEKTAQGNISVFIKMQVNAIDVLTPRRPEDGTFCRLFVDSDIVEDSSDEASQVITAWLVSHGIDKNAAMRAAADDDFRCDLDGQLQNGVENLIMVYATRELGEGAEFEMDDDVGGLN